MGLSVSIKKMLGSFMLDVSFEHESGVLGLLGASGSGKSMTLKCIAGIDKPDEGRIVLDGRVLFDSEKRIDLPPQKRKAGYLFQSYALFPNMTARGNIESGVKGSQEERKRIAEEKIEAFYLEGLENKYPRELSGGQQQRVALARILASGPETILLDEPFSSLDSYLKWKLETELADRLKEFGGAAVFVSHDRDEMYRVCDTICVLSGGKSEPVTPVSELFDNPRTVSAALLSGCKNYSAAEKIDERAFTAADWGVILESNREVPDDIRHIGVRAHYVKPAEAEPGGNVIECNVARVTQELFSTSVMLRPANSPGTSDYSDIRMELSKEEWSRLGSPERLNVKIDSKDILLLR